MPNYTSAKDFRDIANAYFIEHSKGPTYMRDPDTGRIMKDSMHRPIIENMNEPTLLGLCLALGLGSHVDLLRLHADPEYGEVSRWAVLKVAECYERMIQSPHVKPTGLMTAFKSLFAIDLEETKKGTPPVEKKKGMRVVYTKSRAALTEEPQGEASDRGA